MSLVVKCQRMPHGEGMPLPRYQTEQAAGMDLHAAVESSLVIDRGAVRLVPTGYCLEIPPGYEGQVRMRSGLALKHGLFLPNAPGTIDADYRGEIQVIVMNAGAAPFVVERGMRIAQLVVARVEHVRLVEVADLANSERGAGGFGHTGR